MSEISFSIIIPVYNTEKYIARAINSVLNQNYNKYEIIVINDGSTDDSERIILELFQQKREKCIYYKQKNKGLSVARNKGLQFASGDYIIWLDSDDALQENALSEIAIFLKQKPDVIINRIASYFEVDGSVEECKYYFKNDKDILKKDAVDVLYGKKNFWYAAWCFIPSRQFLLNNNILFKEDIYHEDELWSPMVVLRAKKCVYNNFCYYLNTALRKDSIITKSNIKKEYDKLLICNELVKQKDICIKSNAQNFINKRIFILFYSVYEKSSNYNDDEKKQLLKQLKRNMSYLYGYKWRVIYIMYLIMKKIV